MKTLLTTLYALALAALPASAAAFDHSHAAFTEILQLCVHGNRVDYESLKKSPAALEAYLESLAAVTEEEFGGWTEEQRIAFLVNLYNAATLKLIVDHYPVESIKDIGGLFSSPWKQKVVDLFGEKTTLDHVEHGLLREDFREPRIHFAVNCASLGCPDLRPEAYHADRLDEQLEEQARAFLSDRSRNRVEGDVLCLSQIFDWFAEDFTREGTVAAFVAPYFPESDREAVTSGELSIEYLDYDWTLNGK